MDEPKKKLGRNKGWDNIIPPKKGEVRNPNGRPKKGDAWADIYNKILDSKEIEVEVITREGKKEKIKLTEENTMRYALGVSMLASALKGNVLAARELADRTIGKPQAAVDITTDGDKLIVPTIYIPDNERSNGD